MASLEQSLRTQTFGYDATIQSAMRETAERLFKERRDRALPPASDPGKNYERLVKEALSKRGPFAASEDGLGGCTLAQVILRILLSLSGASTITDEVGFESAQCLLGAALFQCVEWANAADDSERDVCLSVVKRALESTLCQERFVRPLIDAHPLSSCATALNCSPKLAELVSILEPLGHQEQERPLRGIIFVQTRASARRVVNSITTHPKLREFVRPAIFCGHAEMTSRAQESVRQAFEVGRFNLLVATVCAPTRWSRRAKLSRTCSLTTP